MEFKREKVSSLAGHTEVRQTETAQKEGDAPDFLVVSAKFGVQFRGVSSWISDRETLEKFAQAVGKAWDEYLKLKPRIEKH